MKLNEIKASEELKKDTLEKAKTNAKKPFKIKTRTVSAIAAALVVVLGISFFAPKLLNLGAKYNSAPPFDEFAIPEKKSSDGFSLYSADSVSYDDGYLPDVAGEIPEGMTEWTYGLSGDTDVPVPMPKEYSSSDGITDVDATPDPVMNNGQTENVKLTGAKLNDNEHFSEWLDKYEKTDVCLNATHRIKVNVKSENGKPVYNATVKLLGNQSTVYTARTDNKGNAYLFHSYYNDTAAPVKISVEYGNEKASAEINGNSDSYDITLKSTSASANEKAKLDLMFMVDTTGSMGDELNYLTNEMYSMINGLNTDTRVSVNFYRDECDQYVVKTNDFTSAKEAAEIMAKENADGGGDTPEAVDKALKAAANAKWNENSVKIVFLVLDAPAHFGTKSVEKTFVESLEILSSKGVRVIPVMASGADSICEDMCRQTAIMTGGEFVFITDHSGLGGSHREPITEVEYEVKPLMDVLADVINDFCDFE